MTKLGNEEKHASSSGDESTGADALAEQRRQQQLALARRDFLERTVAVGAVAVGAAALAALSGEADAQAQQAGNKVNSTKDWMLFTDKSRTGGVLCTGTSSLAVTSAFVQGFEATYFNKDWKTAPTTADLRSKANGLEGGGQASGERLDRAVTELVTATGVFTLGSNAQALSMPSSKVDRTPGELTLNGKRVWRPGGEIMTRLAGSANLTFVVGPQDLRGKLTPSSRLGAVGLIAGRPGVTASGDGCGACGTCGICGLCILCGEVNAGVAGAVSAAAISVTSLSSVAFSPTTLDPITDKLPTGVRDLQLATSDLSASLARFNTAVTKVRAT
jgi:hypothetical protein